MTTMHTTERHSRDDYTGALSPDPIPVDRGTVYGYPERPGVRRQTLSGVRCG